MLPTADIYNSEPAQPTTPVEPADAAPVSSELPKGDSPEESVLNDAAKHFQSLADKRLAENERLKVELEQLKQREIPKVTPEVKPLEPPKKPQRPLSYDRVEAVTDPNSASYKYEQEMEVYRDALTDYQTRLLEEKTKFLDEARKQKEEEQQFIQRKSQAISQFQSAGADPKEASEMFEFLSSPDSLSPNFLLTAYRTFKGQSTQTQQKINNMAQRSERMKEPLPASVPGGDTTPEADDAKSFMSDLRNRGKRNLFATV